MNPWDKVGIEFEFVDINLRGDEELISFIQENFFRITHDASVESPAILFDSRPIKGVTLSRQLNNELFKRAIIGGEIVTPILHTDTVNWVGLFDKLFSLLKFNGERPKTNRGSIHIHVTFPLRTTTRGISVNSLLKAWLLAGYLEAFFYRIGCVGRVHRGDNFDFIYCRPITKNGPPIIRSGDLYYPLLNYDDVLESKTFSEFMVKCGDIWNSENKYHPCRYMWINFYNLYHYVGSPHLEFRVFNKTMRVDYLYAIVELCKAFVKTSQRGTLSLLKNKVNNQVISIANPPRAENDAEKYFYGAVKILNLDQLVTKILKRIWDSSRFPFFDNCPVMSHLPERFICFPANAPKDEKAWYPKKVSQDVLKYIRHPNYIDSHILDQRGITIFPEEQKCAN